MKHFIVLASLTDAGRLDAAGAHAHFEKAGSTEGITVKELFFTRGGPCDAVVVVEARDDAAVDLYALNLSVGGFVKTTTLSATSAEDFGRIVGQITHP
jgi:uncharacterized protein with GYD domain